MTPKSAHAPEVALPWLVRLRWVAVCGQSLTLGLIGWVLELDLAFAPLLALIATTALTNVLLYGWLKRAHQVAAWLLPAVLVLDTLLFTALLYFCGGPENPFALLYVIHVAMATVTLSPRLTWLMVVLSGVCYGLLFLDHRPLPFDRGQPGDLTLYEAGTWFCLTLVAGVMAYFVGRVMAALREREEQLTRVRTVAARNERLASLTTLATGAAHELGTPLGTIAVVARELELAAQQAGDAGRVEDAQLIRAQVDRCRGILDRMTVWADKGEGRLPEALSPADLLSELRGGLGRSGEVVTLTFGGVDSMTAPRQDLVEALVPLLQNALYATSNGGPVALEVGRDDGHLRFSVRDGGSGMSAETLSRASEPFYTTKPPGEGTGLGLHHVRLVAERLGGKLELDSKEGEGTVATLTFPEPRGTSD